MLRWDAIVVTCLSLVVPELVNGMSECYNHDTSDPQVCLPPFVNAAFDKKVDATNTCGLNGLEEYCVQTGATGVTKSCHFCDGRDRTRQHNASLLTDVTEEAATTWWQSQTMLFDVQHPSMVNLTLDLGEFVFLVQDKLCRLLQIFKIAAYITLCYCVYIFNPLNTNVTNILLSWAPVPASIGRIPYS